MQHYESYKPSGIQWVEKIPSHWGAERAKWLFDRMERPVRPEDDVVTAFRDGQVTLRTNRRTEGFTNAIQEHGYQGIRKGDLVIHAMDAFAGAIGVSDSDGKSTPVYAACVPRGEYPVNSYYYAYLLRYMAHSGYIESLSKGIRERSTDFRFAEFRELPLPIPDQDEQDRIVAFLDQKTAEIDAAIAKKERLIELLGEQKEGLISRAVLLGLRQQVELRKSSIKWLKNIPNGWEELPCRYLFREVTRRDRDGSEQKLSVTQRNGLVPTDQMAEHSTQAQSFDEFKLCHVGDLVLNKYKAHLGVFWAAKVRGIITNNYTVFQPTKKAFPPYFELLFHTKWMCDQFASVVYGIVDGMMPLYTKDFYSVQTLCPPLHEQQEIVSYCDEVTKKIDSAIAQEERAIQLLRELKTALVTSYVTGKAKV